MPPQKEGTEFPESLEPQEISPVWQNLDFQAKLGTAGGQRHVMLSKR